MFHLTCNIHQWLSALILTQLLSSFTAFSNPGRGSESGTRSQSLQGERKMQVVRSKLKKTPTKTERKINPEISKVLEEKIYLATKEQKSTSTSPAKPGTRSSRSALDTKKSEEAVSLHIWDFAGHELYYTTHQVLSFVDIRNHTIYTFHSTNIIILFVFIYHHDHWLLSSWHIIKVMSIWELQL